MCLHQNGQKQITSLNCGKLFSADFSIISSHFPRKKVGKIGSRPA
jgi:hypothetical protein